MIGARGRVCALARFVLPPEPVAIQLPAPPYDGYNFFLPGDTRWLSQFLIEDYANLLPSKNHSFRSSVQHRLLLIKQPSAQGVPLLVIGNLHQYLIDDAIEPPCLSLTTKPQIPPQARLMNHPDKNDRQHSGKKGQNRQIH